MTRPRPRTLILSVVTALTMAGGLYLFQADARAQTFRSGQDVSISGSEAIDGSLYVSGKTLDIAGQVNGDVICGGQNVTVSGTVEGDVICAAQNIRITGTVKGDVRLAAQTASIEGEVQGNASLVSQMASVSGSGSVGGDLGGLAEDVNLNGRVSRDVAINASTISVNAPVGRNITAQAQRINLGNQARVAGDLRYTAPQDVQRDQAATVGGDVQRSDPRRERSGLAGRIAAFVFFLLLAMLLISMVLVLLLPQLFQRAARQTIQQPGTAVLTGLGISLLVPALILGLSLTVIGLPLALTLGLAYILALTLAGPTAAYLLGRVLLRNSRNAVSIMLVGSLILLALYLVPGLNILFLIAAMLFGLGSLALALPRPLFHGYGVPPLQAEATVKPLKKKRQADDE